MSFSTEQSQTVELMSTRSDRYQILCRFKEQINRTKIDEDLLSLENSSFRKLMWYKPFEDECVVERVYGAKCLYVLILFLKLYCRHYYCVLSVTGY